MATFTALTKFYSTKKFLQYAQVSLYCRKISRKKFRQCSKGRHILYAIIAHIDYVTYMIYDAIFNAGQKIRVIKFSSMRAGGKLGENLSWRKFLLNLVSYEVK